MSNKDALMFFWHDHNVMLLLLLPLLLLVLYTGTRTHREAGGGIKVLPGGLDPRWKSHGSSSQHSSADEKVEIQR